MIMTVENVVVSVIGYGTCLRWESGGFRYHIWEHTPETIFKNPPDAVQHRGPGYFPTRQLNPASKNNAAMLADARRIANEQGLYDKATDAERQRRRRESRETQAAIILSNKRKAVEEMYDALEFALAELSNMTTTQFSQGKDKAIRERIREVLAKADGQK